MILRTAIRETPGIVDSCEGLLTPCEVRDGKATVVRGDLYVVSGWIYCERPIKSVTIFAGDLPLGAAEFGFPRPDVADALGKPDAKSCGFRALITTADLDLGDHTLSIECSTDDGAWYRGAHDSLTLSVARAPKTGTDFARGHIDTITIAETVVYPGPLPVALVPGDVAIVQGWVLTDTNEAGAAAALLIDGKIVPALYGFERPDLAELFGESARHCGFIGKIDVDSAVTANAELMMGVLSAGGTRFCRVEDSPIPIVNERSAASEA